MLLAMTRWLLLAAIAWSTSFVADASEVGRLWTVASLRRLHAIRTGDDEPPPPPLQQHKDVYWHMQVNTYSQALLYRSEIRGALLGVLNTLLLHARPLWKQVVPSTPSTARFCHLHFPARLQRGVRRLLRAAYLSCLPTNTICPAKGHLTDAYTGNVLCKVEGVETVRSLGFWEGAEASGCPNTHSGESGGGGGGDCAGGGGWGGSGDGSCPGSGGGACGGGCDWARRLLRGHSFGLDITGAGGDHGGGCSGKSGGKSAGDCCGPRGDGTCSCSPLCGNGTSSGCAMRGGKGESGSCYGGGRYDGNGGGGATLPCCGGVCTGAALGATSTPAPAARSAFASTKVLD